MADTAGFQIVYDGEGVRSGEMDVRQLAPALLAVGELLEQVSLQVNGPDIPISVNVKADFQKGSFGVDLNIVQGVFDHAKHVFLNQQIKDARDILTIAGFFGVPAWRGYLYVKKKLDGKSIESSTALTDGTVQITFSGGFEVTKQEVVDLLRNDRATSAAEKIVAPVATQGIDEMRILDEKQHLVETINKSDLPSFTGAVRVMVPISESVLALTEKLVSRRETVLRILKPSFERGKYHVAEGKTKFFASVEDIDFLAQVENDEIAFSAHGKLRVILRQEVDTTHDSVSHVIEHVLQYIKAPRQENFNLEAPTGPTRDPRSQTPSQE